MAFRNPFTEHPHDAGETYFQHMGVALGFARQTIGAGVAALVHAFFPMFHKTTTSERIKCLNACIETGNRDAITMVRATRVMPCADAASDAAADDEPAPVLTSA
ncbi:MAG: DUF6356 family protein [Actinomycetota bacterium]